MRTKAPAFLLRSSAVCTVPRRVSWWWGVALLAVLDSVSLVQGAEPNWDSLERVLDQNCYRCHDRETQEAGLDLTALTKDLNERSTIEKWILVHDRVQSREMPPADEPQPESTERNLFVEKLAGVLHESSLQQQQADGRSRARRLNRDEYQNTLRDLLGVHRDFRTMLPEDGRSLGFDKVASALSVSAVHLEAYMAAAEAAIDEAFTIQPSPALARLPQRFENLTRIQRIFSYQFKSIPDGLVYFSDHWDNITGFQAREPGRYRFKVRGRAFQDETPVKARLRVGLDDEGSRRLVGYAEFPPDGSEIELTTWLNPRETLHVCGIGIAGRAKNLTTHRVPLKRNFPGAQYKGPGLALEWVEVEGPLPDQRFHQSVLGDVDLQNGSRVDAELILKRFMPLAFRRPITEAEHLHFLKIFDGMATEENFLTALKQTFQAILCSPNFLYLHGLPGSLDDYGIASRLSYFLWNSMPDEQLLKLAENKELHRPNVLEAQVERMLADTRAAAFSESFTGQWLELRQINATTPDPELYPEFDELLEWSSVQETRLFFDEMLKHDLSLRNFIDSNFAMLNDRIALHYGIPDVEGVQFRKVDLPSNSVRGGLLTQASVLKVTANGTTSSPILRGAWVMDRIVGKTPPPPPVGVPGLEPDIRGATSIREQLAKHRADATCAACHAKIDPPGFALESFDVIGGWRSRYRTTRDGAKETISVEMPLFIDPLRIQKDPTNRMHRQGTVGIGPKVDASSEYNSKDFHDIVDFRRLLLEDEDQIARSFIGKLVVYATGAGTQFADRKVIEDIVQRAKKRNYGLRATIQEVVQSPLFLNR